MNAKKEIIEYIRLLGAGLIEPEDKRVGLCNVIEETFGIYITDYIEFSKWEYFSGWNPFPIPGTRHNPATTYVDTKNKWDNDNYGDLRRKFCIWVADELEKIH